MYKAGSVPRPVPAAAADAPVASSSGDRRAAAPAISDKDVKNVRVLAPASPKREESLHGRAKMRQHIADGVAALHETAAEAQRMAARYQNSAQRRRPREGSTEPASELLYGIEARPSGSTSLLNKASVARAKREEAEAEDEQGGRSTKSRAEQERSLTFTPDERRRLNDSIPLGPTNFEPPEDDPDWDQMEPYSRIALKRRDFAHEAVDELYENRRQVQTGTLYQAARPKPPGSYKFNRDAWELSFGRDEFVLITVVTHKSAIQMAKRGKKDNIAEGGLDDQIELRGQQSNSYHQLGQRKYFRATLKDLHRGGRSGEFAGFDDLEMLLFESDTRTNHALAKVKAESGLDFESDLLTAGQKSKYDTFSGGSAGAFEKLIKEPAGTVIAIINPRLLPVKDSARYGGVDTKMITITPRTASSIVVIGKAADFATCDAVKRSGERCGEFADLRRRSALEKRTRPDAPVICDYHQSLAIERGRNHRPEFASAGPTGSERPGSKGYSRSRFKKKGYDGNARALNGGGEALPYGLSGPGGVAEDGISGTGTGATFVVGGRTSNDPTEEGDILYDVNEQLGRGKGEKERMERKRKREELVIAELDRSKPQEYSNSHETGARLKALRKQGALEKQSTTLKGGAAQLWRKNGPPAASDIMQRAQQAIKQRKTQEIKARSGRRGRLVIDDRSGALDSDEEASGSNEDEDNEPSGSAAPKFRYSADTIKKIGFNPLSDTYGRGKDAGEERHDAGDKARDRLLSRTTAATGSLAEPKLRTKGAAKWRNVKAPEGATQTSRQRALDEMYGWDGQLSDYSLSDLDA